MKILVKSNPIMSNQPLVLQLDLPERKFEAVPVGETIELPDDTAYKILGDARYKGAVVKVEGSSDSEVKRSKHSYETKTVHA